MKSVLQVVGDGR